jgi:TatD DNase family protein
VKLTDTHCHLNFDAYHDDLPEVLKRAEQRGIQRVLAPGIDLETSQEVIQIAEQYPMVYAGVGVHPNRAGSWRAGTAEKLKKLILHPKVVVVGEIGLDYYRDIASKQIQKKILQEQLKIARDQGVPVVLHVRNQSERDRSCIMDLLDLLQDWIKSEIPELEDDQRSGVIHSFSGNLSESQRALELGFFIGITGAITFKKAEDMRQVTSETPLEKLLVETDGPFITPHPFRGKRNEPAHIRYIIDKISEITGLDPVQVAEQTSENAGQLFGWE